MKIQSITGFATGNISSEDCYNHGVLNREDFSIESNQEHENGKSDR